MEPVASVVDTIKGFAKSSEEFFQVVIHRWDNSARHNPIEILKRLQREAFSDLMKLRDRQDKVERMLSFYKSSKGNPFQEASTHLKGEVDVVGALLLVDNINRQTCDIVDRAGVRTGTDSRFIFEATIRQKDSLVTEFMASQRGQGYNGGILGSMLSLTKVMYTANVSDWCSAVLVPVGARCRDVEIASNLFQQGRSLTDFSLGPPLLNQYYDAAAAILVRRSKVAACLAEFVSGLGMQPDSTGIRHCLSTFGQVICQLSKGTKLTLLGIHKMPKSLSQQIGLGFLTVPVGNLRCHKHLDMPTEASLPSVPCSIEDNVATGSIALMLESDLDESSRIRGWVEMQKSNPRYLQWAVALSDIPEDELGWGLSLGGLFRGSSAWDHFQVEAFLKFNSGKRFSFQPGFMYVMDGTNRVPALMFRSSWSL
ncbi:uncharacterized protein LOC122657483 [Telopea speciosissima]|uniref:uncharacterized protein LOC122657483 n=1 Tax=Telopea speciosissima TaxID=54955 RepID=UPI001CC447BB|nr:uncharacterized protein LOC122657483 [Telopea speciosissima]